jgi:hypothetical protein
MPVWPARSRAARLNSAHVHDADFARQVRNRGAHLRMCEQDGASNDRGRVVRRKVVAVILQHREAVGLDQPARGVAGNEVDLALRQRTVDERQVHCCRGGREVQAVSAREPWIAVLPLEELVPEAGLPAPGVRGEIGQGAQPEPPGVITADQHGERVLEAEWIHDRQSRIRVALADGLEDALAIGFGRPVEDGGLRRARILHVEVDVPRAHRAVADERAAQIESPLDRERCARLDGLGEDLTEQDLLGEILRSHSYGACLSSE